MAEKKLLVGPDPNGSTFAKAFSKAARLPTEEDREAALEQSISEMRKELYQPKYQADSARDTRRAPGRNGWLAEVPIGPPEGISLIDKICDAHLPQPKPRVQIKSIAGIDPAVVRQKLSKAVASGRITKAQMEEQLALLGIGLDAA